MMRRGTSRADTRHHTSCDARLSSRFQCPSIWKWRYVRGRLLDYSWLLIYDALHVPDSGDTAEGGAQFFQLLFVAHVDCHFDQGCIAAALGPGFETADVGFF